MLEITVTDNWKTTFPGGHVGVLHVSGVDNSKRPTPLDDRKRAIEAELREKFAGFSRSDFLENSILKAYRDYYKKFDKTYHVQLQLESVVLKDKSLPNVSPLVDSNFAAELHTLILTAGHDVSKLNGPLVIDASVEGDSFTRMNGKDKALRPDDMVMRDDKGVICTIIYGQDNRSPISPTTTDALYVAYAPPGVAAEEVQAQLDGIWENIQLFSSDAALLRSDIFSA